VRERKGESPCESGACEWCLRQWLATVVTLDEVGNVVESNIVEHFQGFLVDHNAVGVDGGDVGHEGVEVEL